MLMFIRRQYSLFFFLIMGITEIKASLEFTKPAAFCFGACMASWVIQPLILSPKDNDPDVLMNISETAKNWFGDSWKKVSRNSAPIVGIVFAPIPIYGTLLVRNSGLLFDTIMKNKTPSSTLYQTSWPVLAGMACYALFDYIKYGSHGHEVSLKKSSRWRALAGTLGVFGTWMAYCKFKGI